MAPTMLRVVLMGNSTAVTLAKAGWVAPTPAFDRGGDALPHGELDLELMDPTILAGKSPAKVLFPTVGINFPVTTEPTFHLKAGSAASPPSPGMVWEMVRPINRA